MINGKVETAPPTLRFAPEGAAEATPESDEVTLAPVQPIVTGAPKDDLTTLLRDVQRLAAQAAANPSSVFENSGEIINVIEKLMIMLAKEEKKAKHDRYAAKMTKLVERIEKMLAAAQKTLEAGQKELDAISSRSGWQLAFAIIAVIIIAVAIVAAPYATPALAAAVIGAGAAAGGILAASGGAVGELAAKGDVEDKQELNEDAADLNAVATELEKLMENASELSSEAKELLRKLLEILMKIFERLNATRRKQAEGMTS